MRILQLGNVQVVPALRALGHDVRVASELAPDRVVPGRPVDVRALHRDLAPDADAFFMVDTLGRQTLAEGIEDLPLPRVYWAIDVHLNFFWQRHYARLFDLVLVAQQDYVPLFAAEGVPSRWLPWGIDPTIFVDRDLPRTTALAFVGVVDEHRPKRAAAIRELRRFGLVTFGEDAAHRLGERDMARVYGSAKIVFNESVLGDVNFRTFEAMACGALLLTERTTNGLDELFVAGTHLAVYEPDDLVEQVAHFLAADTERERIARAGARVVAEHHTMAARMATVDRWLRAGVPRRETRSRAASAFGIAAHLTVVRGLSDAGATLKLAAERVRTATLAGGDVEAAIALAELMFFLGRDDGAVMVLSAACAAHAEDARLWLLAGEIERRRGRLAEARVLLAGGIAAARLPAPLAAAALAALGDLDSGPAWLALGCVLLATGVVFVPGLVRHVDARLPRTAFDYFMRGLGVARDDERLLSQMAAMLEMAGRWEFARSFRERLVQAVPADAKRRADLAGALHRSYDFTGAAHQRRVADALADRPMVDGTPAEREEAHQEASLALLHLLGGRGPTPTPTLSLRLSVAPPDAFF